MIVDAKRLQTAIDALKRNPHDKNAWEIVYTTLWPFVVSATFRFLRDSQRQNAEDIAQDVFINLFKSNMIEELDTADSLRGYVWKSAQNAAFDHLRKKKIDVSIDDNVWRDYVMLLPSEEATPDAAMQLRQTMQLADDMLSSSDRELLHMLVSGERLPDIAHKLGISYSAAGVRLHRMRDRLRKASLGAQKDFSAGL